MAYRLPFTKLLHHPTRNLLILIFGSHFHALDTSTGALISTTRTLVSSSSPDNDNTNTFISNFELDSIQPKYTIPSTDIHQATIRTLAFHVNISSLNPSALLATSDENKILKVWDCDKWILKSSRPVPKRVMAISFNKDGSQIVTADKFGDVYSHPLDPPDDKHNVSTLLLGHVSMVTDMVITPNNKYVITCDRDEHIRISKFPKGYNIESYCLGHNQFVSKIHILPWAMDLLVSAGGDDFIALWDYVSGRLLQTVNIKEIIEEKKSDDNKEAMDLDPEDSLEIAVTSITSSPISHHIALTIEKFPGIIIFNWNETEKKIQYVQTLTLSIDPLDLAYDIGGNLWVSNFIKEKQNNGSLITVFKKSGNEYEEVSKDHSLVEQINKYGTMTVENLPDLYTTNQLRKNPVDWKEQKNERDVIQSEGENYATTSSITSFKQKKQETKENKKRVKLE